MVSSAPRLAADGAVLGPADRLPGALDAAMSWRQQARAPAGLPTHRQQVTSRVEQGHKSRVRAKGGAGVGGCEDVVGDKVGAAHAIHVPLQGGG